MNRNDKIIAVIGAMIIVLATMGLLLQQPLGSEESQLQVDDIIKSHGIFLEIPDSIIVPDNNPFYALIATPPTVHYSKEGTRQVIPLIIRNMTTPSNAIERLDSQLLIGSNQLVLSETTSPKEVSLKLARQLWESSDTALLIENNETGYTLGVMATPLASYLSLPIIVTDKVDENVRSVLSDLGVKNSLVCGDTLQGFGHSIHFHHVDEIVDATMNVVFDLFGDIDYLTITNPADAWPPEILESNEYIFSETLTTGATTQLVKAVSGGMQEKVLGTFTIPKDYKYALITFEGINVQSEHVDKLGDSVTFRCGPLLEDIPSSMRNEVYGGSTAWGGIPIRDSRGDVIVDRTYSEAVLYDRGGVEYQVLASGSWLTEEKGDVHAVITVEKLSDPYYPMMKDLSSIAPYLTAYHKGIIYGKSEFAFAADDTALYQGEPCPGFYLPRRNPFLVEDSNRRVFENHEDINQVLAKLAGISLEEEYDIKGLHDYYKNKPVYVALVGGATMLPQFIYDNDIEPIDPNNEFFDHISYYWGAGVPSDFIYGNIDPVDDEYHSSKVKDRYSNDAYPFQENIVGRIIGWDAQDASALIARTVFYQELLEDFGNWKDNALVQTGGGLEFKEPPVRYLLYSILTGESEPMKYSTGASYFSGLAVEDILQTMGFETSYQRKTEANYQGFSDDAIDQIKKANLLNRFGLSKRQLKINVGEGVVQGKDQQEQSNFIFAYGHGCHHFYGMGDVDVDKLGLGLPHGLLEKLFSEVSTFFGIGPGSSLANQGEYNTRNIENMELGPSFLWLESCVCGKIDGMYPQQGVTPAYIHSGCNAVIGATTCSNTAGGYIEPKKTRFDWPGQTLLRYLKAMRDARKGIYPDRHFGFRLYEQVCEELTQQGEVSIGLAFRNARNIYFNDGEAEWELWWSPPLIGTGDWWDDTAIKENMINAAGSGLSTHMENKYLTFFEYVLYADPAFIPYVPT
jgi:hypothetical protein